MAKEPTKSGSTVENLDPIVISEEQFNRAVHCVKGLKRGLVEFLKKPKRVNIVNFPIEMDDDSVQSFQGFRVQHNRVFGPGKGGIRYHPDVTMEEVVSLAKLMKVGSVSIENTSIGLPVPIDNNWAENQIRPRALGRSDWLFAGSLRSGQRVANVMSLAQSAKMNGHDLYVYLKDVPTRLPT